ncbi:DNA-binding response regulator [bacterium CPR1]|nr:DNA-binding response regulator [bacterium CPR1]
MAVQELAQGGSYVHPHVAGVVLNRLRGRSDSLAVDEQLSERERSVLGLATNGLNTASIARHLGLSVSTVKSHLRVIYRKLGVSDRTQAVVWALKQGFGHEGL